MSHIHIYREREREREWHIFYGQDFYVQLILIICGLCICEFAYFLKCIHNPPSQQHVHGHLQTCAAW